MEYFLLSIYLLILCFTGIKILLDTESTPKTLSYLLLILVLPVAGILFYFSVGINYRHQKSNDAGRKAQEDFDASFLKQIPDDTEKLLRRHSEDISHFEPLSRFIGGVGKERLTLNNFKLLINGLVFLIRSRPIEI